MEPEVRTLLLERYRAGYQELVDSIEGLSESELSARPADGGWSPREIVHHTADSEMTAAIRLRRLLAEDRPQIVGYDQEEFARRLFYDRPIAGSLESIRASRLTSAEILDRLSPEDWKREGTHSEIGGYNVERWLEIYAAHCHDHAAQIRRGLT